MSTTKAASILAKLEQRPTVAIDGEFYRTSIITEEPAVVFTPFRKSDTLGCPLHSLNWGTKAALQAIAAGTIYIVTR